MKSTSTLNLSMRDIRQARVGRIITTIPIQPKRRITASGCEAGTSGRETPGPHGKTSMTNKPTTSQALALVHRWLRENGVEYVPLVKLGRDSIALSDGREILIEATMERVAQALSDMNTPMADLVSQINSLGDQPNAE